MAKQNGIVKFMSSVLSYRGFSLLPNMQSIKGTPENIPQVENNAHKPRSFMIPLQLQRIRQDIQTWRLAVEEAENAYYPNRVRMQQMFVDKILEGHTLACMSKRKRLTLQKEFCIGKRNAKGMWEKNEEATKIFQNKRWFSEMLSYLLDKRFYGYSLIQLGDLHVKNKEYRFKNLTILKRWHVSPDRQQLVQIPYQTWGLNFLDENVVDEKGTSFSDWMIYVDTPSDVGSSICGFGLLYNVALYSIILRNNLAHNADYTQMFAAPYRHIKTPAKYDSPEYNSLENSAANMGSFGYLITSDQEIIEFIQGNSGTGFQSYADLEKRCQQLISKLILGHADATDPTPGKLGSGQGGEEGEDVSPVDKALAEIEKDDNNEALNDLNDVVLPKLRKLGFPVPEDESFYIPNDKEVFDTRKREDGANKTTAEIAQTMKSAGLKMSAKYFEERTGIPTEDVPDPESRFPSFGKNSKRIINKLAKIYRNG